MSPLAPKESAKTEDRILQNALQHFCNFGYDGTSVREITSSAKVTKPTLYYYFKNKEDLFSRLAQTCFQNVLGQIENSVGPEKNFGESVLCLFETISSVAETNPTALKFIYSVLAVPQKGAPAVGGDAFIESINTLLKNVLDRAVGTGDCLKHKEETIKLLVFAMFVTFARDVIGAGSKKNYNKELYLEALKGLVVCSKNSNC